MAQAPTSFDSFFSTAKASQTVKIRRKSGLRNGQLAAEPTGPRDQLIGRTTRRGAERGSGRNTWVIGCYWIDGYPRKDRATVYHYLSPPDSMVAMIFD